MPSGLVPSGDEQIAVMAGGAVCYAAQDGVVHPPHLLILLEREARWRDPVAAKGPHHSVVIIDDEVRRRVHAEHSQLCVVVLQRLLVAGHYPRAKRMPADHLPPLSPARPYIDGMSIVV